MNELNVDPPALLLTCTPFTPYITTRYLSTYVPSGRKATGVLVMAPDLMSDNETTLFKILIHYIIQDFF